ncbi:hypothetical protein B0H34DRAFT_644259, partial [Crassisporium funariophilum]
KILTTVSSGPFSNKHVWLPGVNDPTPEYICLSSRFYPFFCNAIGATDGTHINCNPSAEDWHAARNRK